MTSDLTSLIARLESAGEGSRELSDAVLVALGWVRSPDRDEPGFVEDDWIDPEGGRWWPAPDPAVSLDDALALVDEGWQWLLRGLGWYGQRPAAKLEFIVSDATDGMRTIWGKAATPALALCAAILRAKGTDNGR